MKIVILAIGRLGQAIERTLVSDYLDRATQTGRRLGLGPVELVELESRKAGRAGEAEMLRSHLHDGFRIGCDEAGPALKSRDFANLLNKLRDSGHRKLVFVIGGADGLDRSLWDVFDQTLAFGPQTWPHALARVMLTEQIYRATSILAGSPYHRD